MYKKVNEKEAVSPVIAVILMVAITVVLAAVLFVMVQQYTENTPEGIEAMSFDVSQTSAGWLVKVVAGDIENNTAVSWYVLDPSTGSPSLSQWGGNITWNDIDADGNINSGDNFVVSDVTYAEDGLDFVIATGGSTVETTLKA